MAHLASLFAQLPGPHARRDALDAILGDLTSYEWRDVTDKLLRRSFRCDVVGSLPVELVALIFQLLPPNAPFLYQTVSRRWRDVLSSSHVISSTLAQWYSDADPKLQGEIQGPLHDVYGTQLLKAEHAWRFQQNKPYCTRRYKVRAAESFGNYQVACVGDNVCWLDGEDGLIGVRQLRLCNLRTGEMTKIVSEARESLITCSLSRSLVAFLVPRGFSVYDIQSREKCYIRLPHVGTDTTMTLTAGENTVAVCYYKYPLEDADVYLHNVHEQKTRRISVNIAPPQENFKNASVTALLLNEDRQMATVFFEAYGQVGSSCKSFFCVSYSFDGNRLQSDSASRFDIAKKRALSWRYPRATDYTNRFYMFACWSYMPKGLYFDNHVGRFSRQMVCQSRASSVFAWKGIVYRGLFDEDANENLDNCELCQSHVHVDVGLHAHERDRGLICGNERFVLAFDESYCRVYCFDKHVELPPDIQE